MNASTALDWARTPVHAVGVLAVLAAVLAYAVRTVRNAAKMTPAAVVMAALGAMLCTAYSGDTSWNFARDHLAMHGVRERAVMFAAGEVALFAVALMARQNLRTDGAPGTPGVLVWVITGFQVIPAYSESGVIAGTLRAFVGPVLAAMLWHLAMGIELRHAKPGAASQGLLAVLTREVRERLLSWLGLSVRGRDAAQITRDRWTRIATRRAARLADLQAAGAKPWRLSRARRRLAVAVDRTDAGVLDEQRTVLLDRLAAYRGAAQLASMEFAAPWATDPVEVRVERVPDAAAEIAPPVPEAVPAGARLLPIAGLTNGPRTRGEVQPEYAPENPAEAARAEPDDDSPPPPYEDNLTPRARRDFLADLMDGRAPGIRALKDRYGIGQPRATRIRDELKAGLT
ncbi:hypothetical protein [Actinacidiphila acidipaludis]|uniref:Uncharacterized protein n=1 Tax=Actinacidiphila acidipaludis TaxID=2873382 RepID=A0ABS7QD87_9ACTN|nr:hypothetical protein [Streptomyces acidipaludis]MBY8879734.1 hypothetical protein [Streptomyces acidipaludis]